jgi:hypothetical protein
MRVKRYKYFGCGCFPNILARTGEKVTTLIADPGSYFLNVAYKFGQIIREKTTSITHCYIETYKVFLVSFVVPMLYPFNKKCLYLFIIQAFIFTFSDPRRSRTLNLLIRSQTLYPIELWDRVDLR